MKKYQISVLTAALLLLFAAFPALAEEEIARVAPAAASEVFEGEDKGANVQPAILDWAMQKAQMGNAGRTFTETPGILNTFFPIFCSYSTFYT